METTPRPFRLTCPECVQGKHTNCTHQTFDATDEERDCHCGCEPSRTCPSCSDVVPEGWSLDDHFNCNWPEDFANGDPR